MLNLKKKRRTYKIVHQKLVLDVDLEHEVLQGYTDLILLPATRDLRLLGLNCSQQIRIIDIQVDNVSADYEVHHANTAPYHRKYRGREPRKRENEILLVIIYVYFCMRMHTNVLLLM